MKTLVLLFSTFGSLFLAAALVPPAPEAVPSADFAVSPANPAVNQEAGFPGVHVIGALNLHTHGYESGSITVSPSDQLRLLPVNEEFLVGLNREGPSILDFRF